MIIIIIVAVERKSLEIRMMVCEKTLLSKLKINLVLRGIVAQWNSFIHVILYSVHMRRLCGIPPVVVVHHLYETLSEPNENKGKLNFFFFTITTL
jgi:hypothetical protein